MYQKKTKCSRSGALHRRIPALFVVLGILGGMLAGPAFATPAVPVVGQPTAGAWFNTDVVTVGGTASGDAVAVRVSEGINTLADTGTHGGYWSVNLVFADGPHTLTARARDGAGSYSAATNPLTITVDTAVPAAPAITVPSTGQLLAIAQITIEGTAEPSSTVTVTADTGAPATATASTGGAWSVQRSFGDGSHTISATATDRAGNTSLASPQVSFRIDTTPPSPPNITLPRDNALFSTGTLGVRGTAEPASTVRVYDGATIAVLTANGTGAWAFNTSFSEGTHSITARAQDAAGNISAPSVSATFTIDLTAPAAPEINNPVQDAFLQAIVAVDGTAEAGSTVELLSAGHVVATLRASDTDGTWSTRFQYLTGEHNLTARARDAANHVSLLSPQRDFFVDADPPSATFTTTDDSVFLPAGAAFKLAGHAEDALGVKAIELQYFNVAGQQVLRVLADCSLCPDGPNINFETTQTPPIGGRYVVKAYAIDRAENRSLPATIKYVKV